MRDIYLSSTQWNQGGDINQAVLTIPSNMRSQVREYFRPHRSDLMKFGQMMHSGTAVEIEVLHKVA